MEIKTALDYVALTTGWLTLVTFVFGVYQYRQTQRWKKMEFVATLMKEFEGVAEVKNVTQMLDWYERDILLFPDAEGQSRFARVTDDTLAEALIPHDGFMDFSDQQVAIRENFDVFLDYLERFDNFIKAGLISEKEFEPYLSYWVDLISSHSKKRPTKGMEQLRTYIDFYDFNGVQRLCRRYGRPLELSN